MSGESTKPTAIGVIRNQRNPARIGHTTDGRRYCPIEGCFYIYKQSTDVSRHKWTHLPIAYLPRCPYRDEYGVQCHLKYIGRAEQMKSHWQRRHKHAGPYPNPRWPSLNDILARNYLVLGETTPRASLVPIPGPLLFLQPYPPVAPPPAIPAHATIPSFNMFECIEKMQENAHWSIAQHRFPEQLKNPDASDSINVTPQGYLQPQQVSPALSYESGASDPSFNHLHPGLFGPVPNIAPYYTGDELIQPTGGHFVPQEDPTQSGDMGFNAAASTSEGVGRAIPDFWSTYLVDEPALP